MSAMIHDVERPLDTIMVGFDDSEPERRGLGRAADLAVAVGAKLVVVSVASPPTPPVAWDAALPGEGPEHLAGEATLQVEHAETSLDDARRLLNTRTIDAEYVSELGSPAERIMAAAEERDADLIVVGTREPGFLDRLLEGSVSQNVSRHTHRDVLIVH